MKKIFLASNASLTLPLVKDMLPPKKTDLKVAFVTTASQCYDDKDFVYEDRDVLRQMGFSIIDVDVAVTQGNSLQKLLDTVDIVFVAGGNTFYLLQEVMVLVISKASLQYGSPGFI